MEILKLTISGYRILDYVPNNTHIKIIYEYEDGSKDVSIVIAWAVLENGELIPVDKTSDLDSTIYILSNKEYLSVDNEGNSIKVEVRNITLSYVI